MVSLRFIIRNLRKHIILYISLLVVATLLACGVKPRPEIIDFNNPAKVRQAYLNRYRKVKSLALSGNVSIRTGRADYKSRLQLLYAAPDSFAFLAENVIGSDLARGAFCGDSGFWEIPHDRHLENITPDTRIYFEEDDCEINMYLVMQAAFFFIDYGNYRYVYEPSGDLQFIDSLQGWQRRTIISRGSLTLVRQIFSSGADTFYVNYDKWRKAPGGPGLLIPRKIMITHSGSPINVVYTIRRIKINPRLKPAYFQPHY